VDNLVQGVHERLDPRQLSEQEVRVYYIDDVPVRFVYGAAFFFDRGMRFGGVFAVAFLDERRADVVALFQFAHPLRKPQGVGDVSVLIGFEFLHEVVNGARFLVDGFVGDVAVGMDDDLDFERGVAGGGVVVFAQSGESFFESGIDDVAFLVRLVDFRGVRAHEDFLERRVEIAEERRVRRPQRGDFEGFDAGFAREFDEFGVEPEVRVVPQAFLVEFVDFHD